MIAGALVIALAMVGSASLMLSGLDWWRRRTRGEFHCKICGSITPLPEEDE